MVDVHHPVPGARSAEEGPALPLVRRQRLVGVDAARGLALAGMTSIHILPAWNPATYGPTLQWELFAGRAAALFALLAGVGLAFASGGRTPHRGRAMTADRVGLLVRAVLITVVGLLINQVMPGTRPRTTSSSTTACSSCWRPPSCTCRYGCCSASPPRPPSWDPC